MTDKGRPQFEGLPPEKRNERPPEEPREEKKREEVKPEERVDDTSEKREELRTFFEREQNKDSLLKRNRLRQPYETMPMPLAADEEALVLATQRDAAQRIEKNYKPGFGIFPCSDPKENFYDQVWTRDLAHAAGNYFAEANPQALIDSLETIFRHQREDGALPLRTEREYMLLAVTPLRFLAKPLFDLLRKGNERATYEGEDFCGAEDTIPAVLVAAGEFFIASPEGREFMKKYYNQFKKAIEFFRKKVDPEDGLAVIKNANPDWADSLYRKGKLGNINIWWTRGLRLMEYMSRQLGYEDDAHAYGDEFQKTKEGVLEKLYNKEEGYFRAKAGEDRVDTVASIFGSLYFLDAEECVRVQETLMSRLLHTSGLKNFDPPYPSKEIFWIHRVTGHAGYHNEFVWPWVTLQNIQVKIKIALQHKDQAVRDQYKQEAVQDLVKMSVLFKELGGAYEIVRPDEVKPASTTFYTPPKNLMGSMAAYLGAYSQLKELGWVN